MQLHSALAANIHAQTIAQRDYEKAQAEADRWESLYQRALKTECEDLASEVRFYKDVHVKKTRNLKALLDEQTERLATLRDNVSDISGLKSLEAKVQELEACSQKMSKPLGNDLETRLRKVESELEAMKAQLLNQQTTIRNLLKENSTALEDVRTLLAEASSHGTTEPASTYLPSAWAILESGSDLDDELAALKEQMLRPVTLQNPEQPPTS